MPTDVFSRTLPDRAIAPFVRGFAAISHVPSMVEVVKMNEPGRFGGKND
jgi:hypothetical protein